MKVKENKARKVKEGSREWRRREKFVLDSYAIQIVCCKHCGSPRHRDYICLFCNHE